MRNRRKGGLKKAPVLVLEGRKGNKGPNRAMGNNNRSMSMAWDQSEALGVPGTERRSGLMSDWDRKDTLYQAYLGNVWISAAIDVIAKRITSGGYTIEKIKQEIPDVQADYDALEQLLNYVNDDEDFLQLVRSTLTDLCIWGETYWEVLYKGGKPYQLHKIDCMSMSYHLDQHGNIVSYEQQMEHTQDTITFQPDEVIRWWFPDPRASKKALSPIERILGATDADGKMADWTRQFFKKGAKPAFWVKLAEDSDLSEANRFIKWFKENYTGIANSHVPPVLFNGAELKEYGKSSLDVDFIQGRKLNREEVLAGFLVPPATVGIIESGNIGGGTGESQDKSLQYNACDPIKQIFFEKFNYRIVQQGFGITNYRVSCRYADYRGDDQISQIQDRRIRNGSLNINEVRSEMGRLPIDGGEANVVVAGKDITPVERFADLAEEQRTMAQFGAIGAQAGIDAANNPPPAGNKNGDDSEEDDDGNAPTQKMPAIKPKKSASKDDKQEESAAWKYWLRESEGNTGIMVAFFPSPDVAETVAIPGYEPVEDLHITLAYLGDQDDLMPGDEQKLIACVSDFAASATSLSGKVSGIGRFTSGIAGQPDPFYASVDIPGLPAWREALVFALAQNGFLVNAEHGYTPHMTLAYIDPKKPMPISAVPMLPLEFSEVWLVIGDNRYVFPFEFELATNIIPFSGDNN